MTVSLLSTLDPDFETRFARIVDARRESDSDVAGQVSSILQAVKGRGDAALMDYTQRFDGYALVEDADMTGGVGSTQMTEKPAVPKAAAAARPVSSEELDAHAWDPRSDNTFVYWSARRYLESKKRNISSKAMYVDPKEFALTLLANAQKNLSNHFVVQTVARERH